MERQTKENAYAHVGSSRRAWGNRLVQPGMIEQAGTLVIEHMWRQYPALQRISVGTPAVNRAARNLAHRLGFIQDGYFKAMETYRGKPMDVVHFGRLRPAFTKREQEPTMNTLVEVA